MSCGEQGGEADREGVSESLRFVSGPMRKSYRNNEEGEGLMNILDQSKRFARVKIQGSRGTSQWVLLQYPKQGLVSG